MKVLGIDPGLKGALVFIDGASVTIFDTPVVSGDYNIVAMARIIRESAPDFAFIERVHSMPGQGVSSSFKFGVGYGIWKGILGALGVSTIYVTPQEWKRKFSLISKPKDESRLRAIEIFPELEPELRLKKDCDRADALLIAYYGAVVYGKTRES